MRVAVCAAVCVAVCVAVCAAVCVAVCVAVCIAACVAVCVAACVAVCVAVCVAAERCNTSHTATRLKQALKIATPRRQHTAVRMEALPVHGKRHVT